MAQGGEPQQPAEPARVDHQLVRDRVAKVAAMREAGAEPYPVRFAPTARAAAIHAEHGGLEPASESGSEVTVAGRLVNARNMGRLAFGVLQDGSGQIQLFAQAARLGERFDAFTSLDLGDWVGASGEVVTTRKGELSVRVDDFALLAKALRPLPEKWHGLADVEIRHRQRYLDLVSNPQAREVMAGRVATVASLRATLTDRGFVEVETPMLHNVPSGALARPFKTHHGALDLDVYLRIAIELHLKRLLVGGVERVFEIGRVFRNEGISPRHNPEFTMLEAYQAFADYHDMIELTEALVQAAAEAVAGTTELIYRGRAMSLAAPWPRVTYFGTVAEATGAEWDPQMPLEAARARAAAADVQVEESWSVGKIVAEVFEARVEPDLWEPTVVMDFPEEISPLARRHRATPGLVERFEVIAAGFELANAFSELNDPVEQRRRFEGQAAARAGGDGEAHPMDEEFLLALEYGMPPAGGLGVGVDRLVMLLTDQASIREVILFPHMRP